MAELVQFTGTERTFLPGYGWVEPGQFLDVSADDAANLVSRRDFRPVGEQAEEAKPKKRGPK